ncbi:hypothetical protein YPPY98_2056, partial [Yersinia pestis PY-98]|jgi:hypothetical protein
MKIYF